MEPSQLTEIEQKVGDIQRWVGNLHATIAKELNPVGPPDPQVVELGFSAAVQHQISLIQDTLREVVSLVKR